MNKLSENEIKFVGLVRAQYQGDQPKLIFNIKDHDAVEAFFSHELVKSTLLGEVSDINTCRLQYQIDGDSLTIARNTTDRTFPFASNLSLARDTLALIYNADDGSKADIWIGLAGQGMDSYSEQVPSFASDLYQELNNSTLSTSMSI